MKKGYNHIFTELDKLPKELNQPIKYTNLPDGRRPKIERLTIEQ